ncbi:TolC family outer membrane protein [Rouxiella sp. Mn2063]|uniref:TolC family outer membrane protein n=1 Tax=Rouxiella sp. Mn2063 TaxID=3395262 RepID=UPI003BEBC744
MMLFKRVLFIALPLVLAGSFVPRPGYALGVLDAYALALEKDPTFQAALKERDAGLESENIGKAGLLPQVSMSYQNGPRNWQTQKYPQRDILGGISQATQHRQYRSYASSVVLTQPLFDYEAYANYKAGLVQAQIADQRYRGKYLNLAVRVITAYVDVANAVDQVMLAEQQREVLKQQLNLNQHLYQAGEGTVTDISETEARYSLSEAQLIDARDDLDATQRNLEAMIGVPLSQLDGMQTIRPGKFEVLTLSPEKYADWEALALRHNPVLASSRDAIEAAKYEIEKNRAGFMPQVQLYASHSENDSSSDNTVNQKYRTDSIGIRVNVPIYSGGGVSASTRQAVAKYGQAMYEKDEQVISTLNDLRKQYNACMSSKTRLAAYELAEKAASLQVEATRKSVMAGQRANIDVLNAQQQLFSTQRDLATAKYNYIKAWVNLLSDSGTLAEGDLLKVARYFSKV